MPAKRKFKETHKDNHISDEEDEDEQPLARKLKLNNTKAVKGKPPVSYQHDDALMFVRDNCEGDPRVSACLLCLGDKPALITFSLLTC